MKTRHHSPWGSWTLRRIGVPLVVAAIAAFTFWGQNAAMAYVVMPFATVLLVVFLRSVERRHLVRGGDPVRLALRSWHALDLFSGLFLAMFEVSVGAASAHKMLTQEKFVGISAGFFLAYVAVAASAQIILNRAVAVFGQTTKEHNGTDVA